jgi:hypothetical protein
MIDPKSKDFFRIITDRSPFHKHSNFEEEKNLAQGPINHVRS